MNYRILILTPPFPQRLVSKKEYTYDQVVHKCNALSQRMSNNCPDGEFYLYAMDTTGKMVKEWGNPNLHKNHENINSPN